MIGEHNAADNGDDSPVQPRHRIRIDQAAFVETEMTAMRQLNVQGARCVGCGRENRLLLTFKQNNVSKQFDAVKSNYDSSINNTIC